VRAIAQITLIRAFFPNAEPVTDEKLELLDQQKAIDEWNSYITERACNE
jgi:hypothetical protein